MSSSSSFAADADSKITDLNSGSIPTAAPVAADRKTAANNPNNCNGVATLTLGLLGVFGLLGLLGLQWLVRLFGFLGTVAIAADRTTADRNSGFLLSSCNSCPRSSASFFLLVS
jgi:hypothetical protein